MSCGAGVQRCRELKNPSLDFFSVFPKELFVYRMFRRRGRSLAAASLLLLAGCGQTGPLYLPPPAQPAAGNPPAAEQPAAEVPPAAPVAP
jgi:predicted small lipoprotein YifL